MSTTISNVIILGAGGSIGPAILQALEGKFNITILSRASSKSKFPAQFKVHTIADHYPKADLVKAFRGQDAVVSCISPWVNDSQKHIIDAAIKAGVKRFIPAEFGHDTGNAKAVELLPPLKVRIDIAAYLTEQEHTGLSWTAFVTGTFFDWGLANSFSGFDLAQRKAEIWDNGDVKFSTSTTKLIGDAVAGAISKPELTANRHVFVSSFTTTQNEVLATLEKVSGVAWDVTRVSSKQKIREAMDALAAGGDASAAFQSLILAIQYTAGNGDDFTGREFNNALGLVQSESMEDVIRNVLKAEE